MNCTKLANEKLGFNKEIVYSNHKKSLNRAIFILLIVQSECQLSMKSQFASLKFTINLVCTVGWAKQDLWGLEAESECKNATSYFVM